MYYVFCKFYGYSLVQLVCLTVMRMCLSCYCLYTVHFAQIRDDDAKKSSSGRPTLQCETLPKLQSRLR